MQQVTDTQENAPQESDLPYAPPQATVADVEQRSPGSLEPAGRWTRLGANIIDTLLFVPAIVFAALLDSSSDGSIIAGLLAGLWSLAIVVVQIYHLATRSQTVGKRIVKVRIMRTDGSRATLGRTLGLRYIVPGLIGAIPFVGGFFSLVDVLFIFREDRRCIHDMIADTFVVQAD